jgi:hypothetical protein
LIVLSVAEMSSAAEISASLAHAARPIATALPPAPARKVRRDSWDFLAILTRFRTMGSWGKGRFIVELLSVYSGRAVTRIASMIDLLGYLVQALFKKENSQNFVAKIAKVSVFSCSIEILVRNCPYG